MTERGYQSTGNLESKEKETPKVLVEIIFGPHATAQDIGSLKDRFDQADIYLSEAAAWTPELYRFINDLSQGKKKPNELSQLGPMDEASEGHVMAELEMIHGSGKPIGFIDIPHGKNEALDRYVESIKTGNDLSQLIRPDFSETLARLRRWVEEFNQLDRDRELHMAEIFPTVIQRILNEHPRFKERQDLTVLIKLGDAHTQVADALKNNGYEVSSSIYKPYPFVDPYDEAFQEMRENGFVSDDLLAKVAVSILIRGIFKIDIESLTDDSKQSEALIGKLTAPLSYGEIKDLYPDICSAATVEQLRWLFLNLFDSHGIKFPSSKEELDVIIVEADIDKN